MECSLCNTEILDELPTCTLMCGHTFHTRCVIVSCYSLNIGERTCRTCNEGIVTPDIREEVDQDTEEPDTITPELQQSEGFKNDIKELVKLYKDSSKAKNALLKKSKETIAEFNRVVKPQLTILKNYKKQTYASIAAMDEYKNSMKGFRKYSRFLTIICGRYNINQYDVRSYLRTTQRIVMHWRFYSIKWMIMRKLKTRVGF
jgi:hypothetical protein